MIYFQKFLKEYILETEERLKFKNKLLEENRKALGKKLLIKL